METAAHLGRRKRRRENSGAGRGGIGDRAAIYTGAAVPRTAVLMIESCGRRRGHGRVVLAVATDREAHVSPRRTRT
jgi:hypothetical protein